MSSWESPAIAEQRGKTNNSREISISGIRLQDYFMYSSLRPFPVACHPLMQEKVIPVKKQVIS
jgi:hypothetical protein